MGIFIPTVVLDSSVTMYWKFTIYCICNIHQDETYENYVAEGDGERIDLVCSSDKEEAKLFGLYLDHKVTLPKLQECGEGMKVVVSNASMSCTYQLWRAQRKVYAEAIYYKTVSQMDY